MDAITALSAGYDPSLPPAVRLSRLRSAIALGQARELLYGYAGSVASRTPVASVPDRSKPTCCNRAMVLLGGSDWECDECGTRRSLKEPLTASLEQVPLGVPFRYATPNDDVTSDGVWMRTAVPPNAPKTFALYCAQVRGAYRGRVVVSGPRCPVIIESVHADSVPAVVA